MEYLLKYFPDLAPGQTELLQKYMDLLLTWNTKINLISRRDTAQLEVHHILHSLALAKCATFASGTHILDLGTGGGLPGIPLAIVWPHCTFTLIDSRGKKITAVQSIIKDLGLTHVTAVHTRAEEYTGECNVIVTRAVASLKELMGWAGIHSVKDKSQSATAEVQQSRLTEMIVWKGGDVWREIEDVQNPKVKVQRSKYEGQSLKFEVVEIHAMIPEPYFIEKYLVRVTA